MTSFNRVAEWLRAIADRDITFRLVEPDDAAFILSLRLDSRLNAHISHVDNDVLKQAEWIRNYKAREHAGIEYYFLILVHGNPVGTVRLYDFREDSFCWGSWIILPGTPRAAVCSMDMVYELGFKVLGYPQSHFEVRQANTRVWDFHQKTGAKLVSETELDRFYVLRASDYVSPLKKRS